MLRGVEARRVYRWSAGFEFPWDYRKALELALFSTYCVPAISGLLSATGEFAERPQRRYDDTMLLMAELAEHGLGSPRGREAVRVVNRLHGRYEIADEDLRYVLATFVFEPIDWIDRYGWRPLFPAEKTAALEWYREVGRWMGIRDIPATLAEFRAVKDAYERDRFRYADTNREIGTYTLDLFCSWYPAPLRPLARRAVLAMLRPPVRAAFGFPDPPRGLAPLLDTALRARALAVSVLPPRRRSKLARDPRNRSYPGYPGDRTPGQLGAD